MNYKKILIIALFFFSLSAMQEDRPGSSQAPEQEELLEINDIIKHGSGCFNGVILIKKENEELFSRAFGITDKKNPEQLSLSNKFCCGSITKQMIACLVLQCAQEGLINLDTPLYEYGIAADFEWAEQVTPRHLLNHSSGIVGPTATPKCQLGTSFVYSNYGYHLLGLLLKSKTKTRLKTLFKNMFEKLGLNDSAFYEPTPQSLTETFDFMASGHMRLYGTNYWFCKKNPYQAPWPLPYLYPAAGGVVTTADDLHKWNQALHNGSIIDQESLASLTTPSNFVKEHYFGEGFDYGYGIWISNNDNLIEHMHNGYVWGYMALNCYYPEYKTSLIILENVNEPLLADTMQARRYTFRCHKAIRDIVRSYLSQKRPAYE